MVRWCLRCFGSAFTAAAALVEERYTQLNKRHHSWALGKRMVMAMLVKWVTKWSNCQLPSPKDANDYTTQTTKKKSQTRTHGVEKLILSTTCPWRSSLQKKTEDSVAPYQQLFWQSLPFSLLLFFFLSKSRASPGRCHCASLTLYIKKRKHYRVWTIRPFQSEKHWAGKATLSSFVRPAARLQS